MRALIRTILGAFLIACLLSPPVYEGVLAVWVVPPPPFRRVFDRVAMLGLAVLAIRERKALGLGLVPRLLAREGWKRGARSLALGLVASILCAAAVIPVILSGSGVARSGMPTGALLWSSVTDLPAALLVGITEECFFRVLVLEALRRAVRLPLAVVLTTLFYASVHFLRPDKSFVYQSSPWSGFAYLGAVLERFSSFEFAWPFVGLVVAGIVLGCTIVRTGSLWSCIGLHAGWFLVRKFGVHGIAFESLAGHDKSEMSWHLLATPWTWLAIAVAGAIVLLFSPRLAPSSPSECSKARAGAGAQDDPEDGEASRPLRNA